jgi:hypothetical protein
MCYCLHVDLPWIATVYWISLTLPVSIRLYSFSQNWVFTHFCFLRTDCKRTCKVNLRGLVRWCLSLLIVPVDSLWGMVWFECLVLQIISWCADVCKNKNLNFKFIWLSTVLDRPIWAVHKTEFLSCMSLYRIKRICMFKDMVVKIWLIHVPRVWHCLISY